MQSINSNIVDVPHWLQLLKELDSLAVGLNPIDSIIAALFAVAERFLDFKLECSLLVSQKLVELLEFSSELLQEEVSLRVVVVDLHFEDLKLLLTLFLHFLEFTDLDCANSLAFLHAVVQLNDCVHHVLAFIIICA